MQNNKFNSFSMRQIPVYDKKEEEIDDNNLDKIKILNLSNSIDKWEQEILFSDKGFYTIKGIDVKEKLPEFQKELEDFISLKISEISFSNISMKEIALDIKTKKLEAIKKQMKLYEQEQLKEWENQVFEDAIVSSVSRAVLYKEDDNIIKTSLYNGIQVIIAMAQSENWNSKIKIFKLKEFKNRFYTELIKAFIKDKNVKAYAFFEKYKDFLSDVDKKEIENSIKELKVNIIAYNYSKELFSYKFSVSEQEKELSNIKDKEIQKAVRQYLTDFKVSEEKQKKVNNKTKNFNNWQEIINLEEFDKAYLYIDYSLSDESIKAKKNYIKQIQNNEIITTDKNKFLMLFSSIFENFNDFIQKDLSDYNAYLSKEDFDMIKAYQSIKDKDFIALKSDYLYIQSKIDELNLKDDDEKYNFIKIIISSVNNYKEANKKEADIEVKNKIIDSIIQRYKKTDKTSKKAFAQEDSKTKEKKE